MNISDNVKNGYWRISYNGQGIYQFIKELISMDEWKKLLLKKEITWLPKPNLPRYDKNYFSFFTFEGCQKYFETVAPIFNQFISEHDLDLNALEYFFYEELDLVKGRIVYKDEFQVVWDSPNGKVPNADAIVSQDELDSFLNNDQTLDEKVNIHSCDYCGNSLDESQSIDVPKSRYEEIVVNFPNWDGRHGKLKMLKCPKCKKENYFINNEEFTEKSHGGYKYEFRFVIGEDDGHLYQITYPLNPDNIISNNIDTGRGKNELVKNIRRTGHNNYVTQGNIVLGITDLSSNKKVNEVNGYPPIHNIGGSISPTTVDGYMKIMSNFIKDKDKLNEIKKELVKECPTGIVPSPGFEYAIEESKKRGQKPIHYKVGDIDDTATYKTTNPNSVKKGMLNLETVNRIEENFDKIYDTILEQTGINLYPEESEYEEYLERSHGLLNYAFRKAVNPENGHFIKIIFDLKDNTVYQLGDHGRQSGRDFEKDHKNMKRIRKTGHNDFSSVGRVIAIVDEDTKERLNTVTVLGVVGSAANSDRMQFPYDDKSFKIDKSLPKDYTTEFEFYKRKDREKIAKYWLDSGKKYKGLTTFTVGEMEKVPSYKATRDAKTGISLYNNQWRSGRGVLNDRDASNPEITDIHPKTALKKLEAEYNKIKGNFINNPDYKEDLEDIERNIEKVKKEIDEKIGDENYGISTTNPRFHKIKTISQDIIYLQRQLRKMKKDKELKESSYFISEEIKELETYIEAASHNLNPNDLTLYESNNNDFKFIDTPEKLLSWMDCIQYGWVSKKDGRVYGTGEDDDETDFFQYYFLQSPVQLIKSKVGVCWDQAEFERKWFSDHGYICTVIYMMLDDKQGCPTHTFLIYETEEGYNWFEHSWYVEKGIHQYVTLKELIDDATAKHRRANNDQSSPIIVTNISVAPKFGLSCGEFMEYCRSQKRIDLNDISNELFGEEVSILDMNIDEEFTEGSHGKLKYCYRIGVDIDTGEEVAVKFKLIPDSVSSIGDKHNITKAILNTNNMMSVNKLRESGLNKLKSNDISKTGYIDFISDELEVDSIFYPDGTNIKKVRLIGLFSDSVRRALDLYAVNHSFQPGSVSVKDLFMNRNGKYSDFKEYIKNILRQESVYAETYKVGIKGGAGKYKTTKLLWDRDLFQAYVYAPVLRGITSKNIKNITDDTLKKKIMPDYIKNDLNYSFKDRKFKDDDFRKESGIQELNMYDSIIFSESSWGRKYISIIIDNEIIDTGYKYEYGGTYFDVGDVYINTLNYISEKIMYQEEILLYDNNDILDSLIEESYTLKTLPDKLYFASPKKITGKIKSITERGLFLTPYKGIASIFIIDRKEVMTKYFNDIIKPNKITGSSFNLTYLEWTYSPGELIEPLKMVHMYHNVPYIKDVIEGSATGYIHEIDVSGIKDELELFVTRNADREVVYKGDKELPITDVIKCTTEYSIGYKRSGRFSGCIKVNGKDIHSLEELGIKSKNINESTELNTSILYFGSPNELNGETVSAKPPRGLILTPYLGVASTMIVDRFKETKKYFNEILSKNNKEILSIKYDAKYGEWNYSPDQLRQPISNVHIYHNIPQFDEVKEDTMSGYIYTVDISDIQNELESIEDGKQFVYKGTSKLPIKDSKQYDIHYVIRYGRQETQGTFSSKDITESCIYECGIKHGQGIDGDDLEWLDEYMKSEGLGGIGEEFTEKSHDKPKFVMFESAEESKNGKNRKKLYEKFIEWCKEYNPRNTFGNVFDEDAFTITYPFVPNEMRYFYRLANPLLCVLRGNLIFFQLSELKKLNSENENIDNLLIFAATQDDLRVFNNSDKKVYKGVIENSKIDLVEVIGESFDLYIQDMIKKGDILNSPIEENNEKGES